MCVDRQELKQGTHLVLDKEYEIKEVIGLGASCVVYLAENCTNSRKVLIKELYPIELGIFRDNKNALVIPVSSQENFAEYKEKLKRAVDLQISFHNAEDSGNSTADVEEVMECNNTLYVVMGRVVGNSYNNHTPENLTSVLKIGRSLTKAIAMYHSKGYLHLDIKAENVFKIKETDELVKLFDFDSVHTKEEIQNGECSISFTPSSASPEVLLCKNRTLKNIDETADLFSIGALMFKKIMGRDVEVEDSRYLKKWDYDKIDLVKTVSPQTKSVLTEIFRHTLARKQKNRYQTAEELMAALEQAIELSVTRIFLANHNITTTTSKDYYISRAEKVKEIREKLENYHIAYLYGIGGIGKSETAREYAETYRSQYDIVHLTHYSIDLKQTIALLNFINLDDRELQFEEKYQLRLDFLSNREMYNANTLLIIDNYNVSPNSEEYEKNVEVLKELKKLDIHILFTTRTTPNDGNRKIDIEELSDADLRALFFAVNPKDRNCVARIAQVNELIEVSFRHTLTVDLVAHQTVQIERFGKKTLADYIAVLKNSGLNNEVKLSVYNNKDDNEKNAIIFDHIKALFDFSELTNKERYVMVNACLLPVSGMETAQFCEFIDLDHYDDSQSSDWGEDYTITNLVNGGWVKRTGEYGERIALHPILAITCQFCFFNECEICQMCKPLFNNLVELYQLPKKFRLTIESFAFEFLGTILINILNTILIFASSNDLNIIYKVCFEYIMIISETHLYLSFSNFSLNKIEEIIDNAIKKSELKLKIKFMDIKTFFLYKTRRIKSNEVIKKTREIIKMANEVDDDNCIWYQYLSLYCYKMAQMAGFSDDELLDCTIKSLENSFNSNILFDVTLPSPVVYQSFFLRRIHTAFPKLSEISSNNLVANCVITICNTVIEKHIKNYLELFAYFWNTSDYRWNVLEIAYYYEILGDCCYYNNRVDSLIDYYIKSACFKKLSDLCNSGFLNKQVSQFSDIVITESDLTWQQLYNISKLFKKEGNIEKSMYYLALAKQKVNRN